MKIRKRKLKTLMPKVECENCEEKIKDEWRILEMPNGEEIHHMQQDHDYEGEIAAGDINSFNCKSCNEILYGLSVLHASEPITGKPHFYNVYTDQ